MMYQRHIDTYEAKFKSVSAVFGWETEDDIALSNENKVSFACQALISQHRTNIVVYTFSANNCWYWLKFSLIRINVPPRKWWNFFLFFLDTRPLFENFLKKKKSSPLKSQKHGHDVRGGGFEKGHFPKKK